MENIKNELLSKLKEVRSTGDGSINIDNFDQLLDTFIDIVKVNLINVGESNTYEDLKKIAKNIRATKEEVASIDSEKLETELPSATLQLQSVAKSTENSSEKIMEATENIQNIVKQIDNETLRKEILDNTCIIMEACSFHDLTSQRINKVIELFEDLEKVVYRLLVTFKTKGMVDPNKKSKDPLLNGPQILDQAPSQKDIDDLFNSL